MLGDAVMGDSGNRDSVMGDAGIGYSGRVLGGERVDEKLGIGDSVMADPWMGNFSMRN